MKGINIKSKDKSNKFLSIIKTFLLEIPNFLLCMLLGILGGLFIIVISCESEEKIKYKHKDENIIIVDSKFDLTKAEYVKRVFKDVTVTSYNNSEEQTDGTPNVTASNRPVREGIVAISQDFLNKGYAKYGDLIYISCFDKWFVIEDTMNKRFEKRLDVFLFDKKESLKINKKCGIEIIHYTR